VSPKAPCIAFTGGGTGGHVYPGLAVIEELRRIWDGRIVWLGSGKELERKAVEDAGVEFFALPSGKLRRSLSLENVADAFRVAAGFFAARRLLRELSPRYLFSKGGYVSVAPCLAAASLGLPYAVHECDLSPGLATRITIRKAAAAYLSWEASLSFLSPELRAKAIVTGNPVRETFEAIGRGGGAAATARAAGRAWLGFGDEDFVVLVLGGSQGAGQVNELVAAALPRLIKTAAVAHQTGAGKLPAESRGPRYHAFEFAHGNIAELYAAADLVVGRAGANTLWEATAAGKPMVLVPLEQGSRGDQVENAMKLKAAGGALVLAGGDATAEALAAAVEGLAADPARRAAMAKAAAGVAKTGAAVAIAAMIADAARAREASQ
jgi:UDP-N-acetylglucosamine--N-acetylmuramyl-(pentapeptide) pyrophosphoryl-undecaprenol N-acetylglucosamine transferase